MKTETQRAADDGRKIVQANYEWLEKIRRRKGERFARLVAFSIIIHLVQEIAMRAGTTPRELYDELFVVAPSDEEWTEELREAGLVE